MLVNYLMLALFYSLKSDNGLLMAEF